MKEFIKKLIGSLEEYKYSHLIEYDSEQCLHCKEQRHSCLSSDCSLCVMDKAIEIVKQATEGKQGLFVKIECHCKDCVHWVDGVAGATEHVKLCTIGTYMTGKNGYCLYAEKKVNEHENKI